MSFDINAFREQLHTLSDRTKYDPYIHRPAKKKQLPAIVPPKQSKFKKFLTKVKFWK